MGLEAVFPDYADYAAKGFAGLRCPKPTVMIAFTPRTGSTHLCAALHEAGQITSPNEIFNPRGPAQQERQRWDVNSFGAYIERFPSIPDEVFIFKTCWRDVASLAPTLTSIFPNMRVVYLSRRNDAAQAVSAFKAELTGTWHQIKGQAPPSQVTDEQFAMSRLLDIHADQEEERQGWRRWFALHGVTPLSLVYEDFEADINIALQALVSALALPLATSVPATSGFEKLADRLSLVWTRRLQCRLLNLG